MCDKDIILFRHFQVKSCHKRQVVAVSSFVLESMIGAQRHFSAIFLIFFEQEFEVGDVRFHQSFGHLRRCHDMVDAAPFAHEFLCTLRSVAAFGLSRDVVKAVLI